MREGGCDTLMTMEPEEGRPEETPAPRETIPPEEPAAEGWYFDIPEGAWERQEAKNRDLRDQIRTNLGRPDEKRHDSPRRQDRTPAWVHDPEPEGPTSSAPSEPGDAAASLAAEGDAWTPPPPTEHHLERPAAHRQDLNPDRRDRPVPSDTAPEPPKYGAWDLPAQDDDFETRALKPTRRAEPSPAEQPVTDAEDAEDAEDGGLLAETDVVEGMRQWASGSGRSPSRERASSRWDEMMSTPADSGGLLEGMRHWATTEPGADERAPRRRLDEDPEEDAGAAIVQDEPGVEIAASALSVAEVSVDQPATADVPAWDAAEEFSSIPDLRQEPQPGRPAPKKRGLFSRLFGRKQETATAAAAAARLAASEAGADSPWGGDDSWQAASAPEEPSEWTQGRAEAEDMVVAPQPESIPEEPATTWLTAPDTAPLQSWSSIGLGPRRPVPAVFQPPQRDEDGDWERPASDTEDEGPAWATDASAAASVDPAVTSPVTAEVLPAAEAGSEQQPAPWDWEAAFPTASAAPVTEPAEPQAEAPGGPAADLVDDPWADFLAARESFQRENSELAEVVVPPIPLTPEAPAAEATTDGAWEAVMAASGYDDTETPLLTETYTDAPVEPLAAAEQAAVEPTHVPSESWGSEEDRDWGPSPKSDPDGIWASATDDDVVLRAFEAHASTEIEEGLAGEGTALTDPRRASFRNLLGDDADELVDDDEIVTDDHPSLSRLQGWAPQREVASVANADPAWALGANKPPVDPSRPDTDPWAEAESATPQGESAEAAAGEHAVRKGSRSRTLVRELVETGLLALLVFLSVRASFQNFKVDGISMQPTLEDGQFLIVNKLVYSEVDLDKLSTFVPFVDPGSDPQRNVFHGPQRGDIIVLRSPTKPDIDLIKRVIGLPGDTVEIRDGHVYINDRLLIEPYIKQPWADNKPKQTIPADQYYVLGDNRSNSADSRSQQVGLVHKDLIIGKAMLSYWPRNKFGLAPNGSPTLEEKPVLSGQLIDD